MELLCKLKSSCVDFIYIDPPFNTGKNQTLLSTGAKYKDSFYNYEEFIVPRLQQAARVLTKDGVICVQLDYREVHYVKVWMDKIFGRNSFKAEIIVHSELGARKNTFWPIKHQTILIYSRGSPIFNLSAVPTSLTTNGKTHKIEDSVWHYTLSNSASERVGYPSQKAEEILRRLILVHTNEDQLVLDFFGGSGTTAKVANDNKRRFITCDISEESVKTMEERLELVRSKLK